MTFREPQLRGIDLRKQEAAPAPLADGLIQETPQFSKTVGNNHESDDLQEARLYLARVNDLDNQRRNVSRNPKISGNDDFSPPPHFEIDKKSFISSDALVFLDSQLQFMSAFIDQPIVLASQQLNPQRNSQGFQIREINEEGKLTIAIDSQKILRDADNNQVRYVDMLDKKIKEAMTYAVIESEFSKLTRSLVPKSAQTQEVYRKLSHGQEDPVGELVGKYGSPVITAINYAPHILLGWNLVTGNFSEFVRNIVASAQSLPPGVSGLPLVEAAMQVFRSFPTVDFTLAAGVGMFTIPIVCGELFHFFFNKIRASELSPVLFHRIGIAATFAHLPWVQFVKEKAPDQ